MLALIGAAWAGTRVLPLGGEVDPAGDVAARTGIPRADLVVVDPARVFAPGPRGVSAAPCGGPPASPHELDAALAAVVADYDAGRLAAAAVGARALPERAACAERALGPDWLWSAAFVSGVVAFASGDGPGADAAWRAARAVDPTRPWDDDFSPAAGAGARFDAAAPAGTVEVHPVGGPFLLDGRPLSGGTALGPHWVQSVDPALTWSVELDRPTVWVHPAVDPRALTDAELARVLAAALPDEPAVYLVDGADVSRLVLATGARDAVAAPEVRRRWPAAALAAGGALVLGSAVNTAVSLPAVARARSDGWDATDPSAWDDARARWRSATTQLWLGYGAGGLGGAAIGIGLLAR